MKASQMLSGGDVLSNPNSTLANSPSPSADWDRKKMFTRKPAPYLATPKHDTPFHPNSSFGPSLLRYSRVDGETSPSGTGKGSKEPTLRQTIGHSGSGKFTIVKGMNYLSGSRVSTEGKEPQQTRSKQIGSQQFTSLLKRSRNESAKQLSDISSRNRSSLSFLLTPTQSKQIIGRKSKELTTLSRDNSASGICLSCANHKEMAQLITQKCAKLEQQVRQKDGQISELTQQVSSLRKEKEDLTLRLNESIVSLREREKSFLFQKSELMTRVDSHQKDLQKLKQKLRYESIENSMLLRFRDQFQMLSQQHQRMKHQNAHLKRLIVQRGGVTKKQSQSTIKSSKSSSGQVLLKGGGYQPEDDCISLCLSEMSTTQQHF